MNMNQRWNNVAILGIGAAGILICIAILTGFGGSRGGFNPPFITPDASLVKIPNLDLDSSLKIAESELKCGGLSQTLALWSLRCQPLNDDQAKIVSRLWREYNPKINDTFGLLHWPWSLTHFYRVSPPSVQAILEQDYQAAKKRAEGLAPVIGGPAIGEQLTCGDAHPPARSHVRSHTVAPGTGGFLASLADYKPCK